MTISCVHISSDTIPFISMDSWRFPVTVTVGERIETELRDV